MYLASEFCVVLLAPAAKAHPRGDGVSLYRGRDGARPGVASAAALFLRALWEGVHVKAQTSAPCAQRSFWVRPQVILSSFSLQ
jgi:hypothetical protein